ncbi:MAG: YebC/PmpR family DNA-binding transcriptional regulator [Armatimonadetes bacterium]|nr:MAG: YebC/PmpR family DNA-binding transcriptional regulator [Armatimonadota bacterium]
MSGHSKWSTIKRQKGVADIKRGQTFTKIANAITIAARLGNSGDPESNPRLRTLLEEARRVNMPKDNIQRAIDRGLGKLPGQTIEEVTYEGFGPGKVAFYIEGLTDNRLRTNQEIKNLFDRSGGGLGGSGSVGYMFDKKGEIRVKSQESRQSRGSPKAARVKEDEILKLIDLGAEDVEDFIEDGIQKYLVYVDSIDINTMGTTITQEGFNIESAEIVFKPNITIDIHDKELAEKVLNFADKLEEHDDIQKVYANFNIPEEIIESSR